MAKREWIFDTSVSVRRVDRIGLTKVSATRSSWEIRFEQTLIGEAATRREARELAGQYIALMLLAGVDVG